MSSPFTERASPVTPNTAESQPVRWQKDTPMNKYTLPIIGLVLTLFVIQMEGCSSTSYSNRAGTMASYTENAKADWDRWHQGCPSGWFNGNDGWCYRFPH
jgi:hypothetical protein